MLALLDNDIVCKLVVCNLFDDALNLLQCTRTEARILRSSKWTVGNRAKANSRHRTAVITKYGAEVAQDIGDLLEHLAEVSAPSPATDDLLMGVDVDPGEAQLFRVAYENLQTVVLTADKRALETLLISKDCAQICQALAGRVVTFESVLVGLIRSRGYSWIAARVGPVSFADGLLRLAFPAGAASCEQHTLECLASYSRHVAALLRPF